jgi:hypothetical protein
VKTFAPLGDLITHSQAQMAAVVAEAKALHERRAKEGRTFSTANVATLEGYAAQAEGIATGIRDLLTAAKRPERAADSGADPAKAADAWPLWLEYQQTIARLHGAAA